MNLECKEPIKYNCPKCGHEWYTKAKRPKCSQCNYNFPFRKNDAKTSINDAKTSIQDDIMKGSILDALDKADVDPLNHKNFLNDAIPLIIKEGELKFAFVKACSEKKNSPEKMIRVILKDWLKEKGYYE